MTVVQLIATAGGLKDAASRNSIVIVRRVAANDVRLAFDYAAFVGGQKPEQNILLKSGDTVIVP